MKSIQVVLFAVVSLAIAVAVATAHPDDEILPEIFIGIVGRVKEAIEEAKNPSELCSLDAGDFRDKIDLIEEEGWDNSFMSEFIGTVDEEREKICAELVHDHKESNKEKLRRFSQKIQEKGANLLKKLKQ